jgi:hypothetical protein
LHDHKSRIDAPGTGEKGGEPFGKGRIDQAFDPPFADVRQLGGAMPRKSMTRARGWPWKLPPEIISPGSSLNVGIAGLAASSGPEVSEESPPDSRGKMRGLSVTALSSASRTPVTYSRASRLAP